MSTNDAVLDRAVRDQHERLAARLAAGMPRAGWKVCVNDARTQGRLGLGASFVGFLDGDRVFPSGAACRLPADARAGVEPEFALRFASAVDPEAGAAAARAAVASAAPALELVDWRGASLDLASVAASSSFHDGFVVGDPRSLSAVPAIAPACPLLRKGDDVVGVPDPALVPADLGDLVVHVAAFLVRFGHRIEAGDWLLCGACTNPAPVAAGDEVSADFAGLGTVSVRFRA